MGKQEYPDKRISSCTDCRLGIFVGTNYLWTRRGLVHTECEDKSSELTRTQASLSKV